MELITTDRAPAAIGPYSRGVGSGDFLFCSGQIGIDPETRRLAGDDIERQTVQVINNLKAVLSAAALDLSHVVKTTLFLTDLGKFSIVNEIYAAAFGGHKPARATAEVSRLPLGALVEIECISFRGDPRAHNERPKRDEL